MAVAQLEEALVSLAEFLEHEGIPYMVIGGMANAVWGEPRATVDIDIWVMPSPRNAESVLRALVRFGAPLHNLTQQDLEVSGTVFQIGVAPRRIDIITAASGLQFEETFKKSIVVDIDGIQVHIPSRDDLIRNKRATGRTKDLADAEALESLQDSS